MNEDKTVAATPAFLPSFRNGAPFEMKKPDVDGFIEIVESRSESKGQRMKVIAQTVLRRSFEDVTMEEIGKMELEDLASVLKVGSVGLDELEAMGFRKTSESPESP